MTTAPGPAHLASILGPQTTVTRRVDIYEEDGETPFREAVPLVSGSVSIDMARAERRTLDLTLDASQGDLIHAPGEFWYDKIIRPYRGAVSYDPNTGEPSTWETSLGVFMVDGIESRNFPHHLSIQARDRTKKLMLSKFRYATNFKEGESIISVIRGIAAGGGVTDVVLPPYGPDLDVDYLFEAGSERWEAITDIATAFNYEVFFDSDGYMVMRDFQDPITSPIAFEFEFGQFGTVASWTKSSVDTRLHNVVVVKGESSETVPHTAVAANNSPTSPTSISEIGERVYIYSSPYITSKSQAQRLANSLLKVHSLEEYSIDFEAIVFPWLEAGEIIRFPEDDMSPNSPTLFLLSSLEIPLGLGPMSAVGKRIVII